MDIHIQKLLNKANAYQGQDVYNDIFSIEDIVDESTADANPGIVILTDGRKLLWDEPTRTWHLIEY